MAAQPKPCGPYPKALRAIFCKPPWQPLAQGMDSPQKRGPEPVFEVNPFLARGAAKVVCKKLLEMLRGVVHMALVARPWEQPVAGHQD